MAFEGFTESLVALKNTLSNILNNILNAIDNLANSIINGIKDLFIPSSDFFTDKINQFKSHFAFIDTFSNFVNKFTNLNRHSAAPVVTIDFSKAESKYNYGGQAFALDLAWYSRYKVIGDIIITAFVYAFFIWRFYCRIPELIRGAGIITDNVSRTSKEVTRR